MPTPTLLPSGDSNIVYPDRARMSVYSSIRLETMLQGIEDYEMLTALKAKDPATASRLAQEAVAGLTDYVRDPEKFRAIERELLEALGKVGGRDGIMNPLRSALSSKWGQRFVRDCRGTSCSGGDGHGQSRLDQPSASPHPSSAP